MTVPSIGIAKPGAHHDDALARRWRSYRRTRNHKVFALGEESPFGWSAGRASVREAKEAAMRDCEKRGASCRIVSIDGWPEARTSTAQLKLTFADQVWYCENFPDGRQCSKFRGKGAKPALRVENIPAVANATGRADHESWHRIPVSQGESMNMSLGNRSCDGASTL